MEQLIKTKQEKTICPSQTSTTSRELSSPSPTQPVLGSIARFEYQDANQTLILPESEIRAATSEIGTLVTVTIRRTVDSGSTSFTLLVPTVNLEQTNQAAINTVGITTIHRFSLIPNFNRGQTEFYTVTELTGTAEAINF